MSTERESIFLVDRDLGAKTVPSALAAAGCAVKVHSHLFKGETPDDEWIAEAGRQDWYVVTRDDRIRYNLLSRRAVRDGRVGVFILSVKSIGANGTLFASIAASSVPAIKRFIAGNERPFFAKIYRDASVKIVPRDAWMPDP